MIRSIAIDNEPLALMQIAEYISKTPFLELTGQCASAMDAYDFLAGTQIDLMFVDINMPDLSGMDFVKSLKNPPKIIFITAYSEYAVEGFRLNAIDYLVKPISYSDFLKSANKARSYLETTNSLTSNNAINMDYLFVKSDYRITKICVEDIIFIEGMREYVKIHLTNSKPLMPLISLRALDEQLPKNRFMRVHRSYIVNLGKILSIDQSKIRFDNDVTVPISEQYKGLFQKYLISHSL